MTKKTRNRDLTNQRFGRLVAIVKVSVERYGHAVWHCECDCGGFAKVRSNNLVRGNTRSCGCFYVDTRSSGMAKARRAALRAQVRRVR